MITLYRRGRVWWARGSVDGKPIKSRSLDTQFKNIAAKRAARLEFDLDEGITAISWDAVAREFLAWTRAHRSIGTLRKYKFTVHRFGRFLQTRQRVEQGLGFGYSGVATEKVAAGSSGREGGGKKQKKT